MAPKGGGRGAPKDDLLKGRKLISGQRYVGCIAEWHSTWGWVEPLDVVNHPQIKKNKGRIYVNKTDSRGYLKMEVGTHMDFKIYCDARGLGAVDCTEVQKGAIKAAAAVAEAAEDEILPEGWEKHWSAENEEYFYWNRLTKQTSWLPPVSAAQEEDEIPLPAGWTKHYDEENQEWYYWNKKDKQASWERPTLPADPADEPPTKKAKLAEDAGEDAPILGQQRVKGRIAEWHGIFGWIVPSEELTPELKPLLQKGEGKIYVNWRDVQPGVEAKVNMDVEFMLHEDDNGLAASDVGPPSGSKKQSSKIAGVAHRLASTWAEEDAAMEDAEEEGADNDATDGPLMPGWDQHWSDEHECYYYWHKATKVAAWERPTMPVGDDDEEDEEQGRVWEGEGSEEGAAHMATPQTPFVSKAGRDMTPTTPVSPQAGRIATNHTAATKAAKAPIGGSIPAWKANQATRFAQW
mmetsp:Transcript_29834/g.48100  ORF Transcript_29834/g.48100 Transcript_29834/m.48100 type:complete len:462 (-) Transcript_29834:65-1450(-)